MGPDTAEQLTRLFTPHFSRYGNPDIKSGKIIQSPLNNGILCRIPCHAKNHCKEHCRILTGMPGFKPEDVSCRGCRSDHGLFTGCTICAIRKCCREKNLETCAECID